MPSRFALALVASLGCVSFGAVAIGPAAAQQAPPPEAAPPSSTPPVAAPPPVTVSPVTAPPALSPPPPAEHGTPAVVLSPQESEGIIGKSVRSAAGEDMGRIVDIIVTASNQPRAAIIDFGGFLGVGSRKIAVDWRLLQYSRTGKTWGVTFALTRNQVRVSPEYKPGEPVVVLGIPAAPPAAAQPTAAAGPVQEPTPPPAGQSPPQIPPPSASPSPAGGPVSPAPAAPDSPGDPSRPPQ